MKAEEKIKEELIENIRHDMKDLIEFLEQRLSELESAETVEKIMLVKQRILLDWLDLMPLGCDECYFCLLDDLMASDEDYIPCYNCKYAEHHGVCFKEKSDYARIAKAKKRLRDLIERKYYRGEEYEQETC